MSKFSAESTLFGIYIGTDKLCILRFGTLSGVSPRMRLDLFVNTMWADAKYQGKITLKNSDIWRPLVSVQDAARAIRFAIEHDFYGVFNVAGGNFTVGAVAESIENRI